MDPTYNTDSVETAGFINSLAPIEHSKGDIFRKLNQAIALSDHHIPTHLYRADLIPLDIFQSPPQERQAILNAATLEVTFTHGYPAFGEVTPIWERLPCETEDAFNAFVVYLELPEKTEGDNIRFLPLISHTTKIPVSKLADYCHIFYWHWRSRAYDLFIAASLRKQREMRIMSIEGKHFKMAEEALSKVMSLATMKLDYELALAKPDKDGEVDMEGTARLKEIIDMADKLVAIQRVSVGLPAKGPATVDVNVNLPRNAPVQEVFKQIAKESVDDTDTLHRSEDVDALLQNPDDLASIQEMMIRLSNPQHTLPAWGGGKTIDLKADEDVEAEAAAE